MKTRMQMFRNRHGVLFKIVQVGGTLRIVAQNRGEVARWDTHVGVGMVGTDMAVMRYANRDEWDVAVKVTASTMRSE